MTEQPEGVVEVVESAEVRWRDDGTVEVVKAPPLIEIADSLLDEPIGHTEVSVDAETREVLFTIFGRDGNVVYRVEGYAEALGSPSLFRSRTYRARRVQ